jgi:hypothetical protein
MDWTTPWNWDGQAWVSPHFSCSQRLQSVNYATIAIIPSTSSCFENSFFPGALSTSTMKSNILQWNQETDQINTPNVGDELVPIQVGSNILHIIDTADPNPNNSSDPGKLSFKWGTQTWDSFSPGSPCNVTPAPQYGMSANYECSYQCDH